MTFNVVDYWPPYLNGAKGKSFFLYAAQGACPAWSATFESCNGQMLLKQYDAAGNWLNTWYLEKHSDGLWEVQDDLPQTTSWLKTVFGAISRERYSTPIGWGNIHNAGGVYSNSPQMSLLSSPPQTGNGTQVICFEGVLDTFAGYRDVLQLTYQQSWDGKPATGARMWLAKGIGPVGNQWLSAKLAGPIQIAKVSHVS